jgi:hypothetical protein
MAKAETGGLVAFSYLESGPIALIPEIIKPANCSYYRGLEETTGKEPGMKIKW